MAYTLTQYERETVLTMNEADTEATFYTCSPVWIRRLDKLCTERPESFRELTERRETLEGQTIAKTYLFPKEFLKVRPGRNLSEEQRQKLRERASKIFHSEG